MVLVSVVDVPLPEELESPPSCGSCTPAERSLRRSDSSFDQHHVEYHSAAAVFQSRAPYLEGDCFHRAALQILGTDKDFLPTHCSAPLRP